MYLRELEHLESRISWAKESSGESVRSEGNIKALQNEALEVTMDRYRWINERKAEMGLDLEDLEDLERQRRKSYDLL